MVKYHDWLTIDFDSAGDDILLAPFALTLLVLHQTPEDQLSTDRENESLLISSVIQRTSTFISRSKSSISFDNSLPISSIISEYEGPPVVSAATISTV